jgi:cyclopropane-fatty-acyl-phospholipid synthase
VTKSARRFFSRLMTEAGIEIGGTRPWDIQIHDERLYGRLAAFGSLGLGESYMDGWWDAESIDQFIYSSGSRSPKSGKSTTTSATTSTRPCSTSG